MIRVYAALDGGFWRLTPEKLHDILRTGASGKGFSLDPDEMLSSRPMGVKRVRGDRTYYAADKNVRIYQFLGWDTNMFVEEMYRIAQEGI